MLFGSPIPRGKRERGQQNPLLGARSSCVDAGATLPTGRRFLIGGRPHVALVAHVTLYGTCFRRVARAILRGAEAASAALVRAGKCSAGTLRACGPPTSAV